jgi:Peptidase family C25
MDVNDVFRLHCRQSAPIAVFLACYTGAFDGQRDCLAEEMLRAEGGPVAVISGSRMTMPYAMSVMSSSMMYECFAQHRETIGEVMLYAKRSMMEEITDQSDPRFVQRQLLDAAASLLTMNGDKTPLLDERRDHVALFHVLGDPLLRLREPLPVSVDATAEAQAGSDLSLTIHSPLAGHCTLELACRRDLTKVPFTSRSEFDDSDRAMAAFSVAYRQANDQSWQTRTLELKDNQVATTTFAIPDDARGPCVLRAHVAGPNGEGLGATTLFVRPLRR